MPRPAIHPGEILADGSAEIGIVPAELARQSVLPIDRLGVIVEGRGRLDGDTALRSAQGFRDGAQFRLDLQTAYDIGVAGDTAGAEIANLPARPEGGQPTAA